MSHEGCTWLETKKVWPLGKDSGLNVFHLPLQNHSAPLCPLHPEKLVSTDCSNRLPWHLGLLGFCQWETPTGNQRVGKPGPVTDAPAPSCWAARNSIGLGSRQQPSLPAVWPAPSGQDQGPLPWGTEPSFVGFPTLSWCSWLNTQPPHLRVSCGSPWAPNRPFPCQFCIVLFLGQFCLWLPISFQKCQ